MTRREKELARRRKFRRDALRMRLMARKEFKKDVEFRRRQDEYTPEFEMFSVWLMRKEGLTYRDIDEVLGLYSGKAFQMLNH